jgi:hypothetical protein
MVEFLRGQLDIFQFKRFYEEVRSIIFSVSLKFLIFEVSHLYQRSKVREKLSALVKNDYFLQLLDTPNTNRNRFKCLLHCFIFKMKCAQSFFLPSMLATCSEEIVYRFELSNYAIFTHVSK